MAQLISLEEAISVSCENIQPLDSEYLYINNANMRVLAEDINSTIDIPNFDRSAVDGYAIGTIDLEKLNAGHRACLQVAATIQAGAAERKQVRIGEAYRIMTGAMIPEGCAAIIKQEDVGLEGGHIVVCGSWKKGKNILRAGYELRAGDNVCTRGQIISPEVLERIAACGINKILVHKIPRIYVIDTGTELVLPGSVINTGQIYGSSRSLIAAKIDAIGAIPLLAESIVEDDMQAIVNEVERAVRTADMVIISGGTGNGVYDLVNSALEHLHARILFRGINIAPGKGTSAAILNDKLVYNLSGNPSAAGLLFDALIKPAIIKQKGDIFSHQEWFNIQLNSAIKSVKLVRSLCRGEMIVQQGRVYAKPIGKNIVVSNAAIALILDIQPGQGMAGDIISAKLN